MPRSPDWIARGYVGSRLVSRRAAIAVVALATVPSSATAQDLPPLECVRALREARIERVAARAEEELEALRRARMECGDELEPLFELVAYHGRQGLEPDEHRRHCEDHHGHHRALRLPHIIHRRADGGEGEAGPGAGRRVAEPRGKRFDSRG